MKYFFCAIALLLFGTKTHQFKLQLLHNNDLHARFEETDAYGASCPAVQMEENNCYGGFARMKQQATTETENASQQNISTIFINAGDTFQGTPYYTLYKQKITLPLMNSLGLDAMTLGNHEFDEGIKKLVKYLDQLNTPVLACNFNLTSEPRLQHRNLMPSLVMTVDGHRIGLIGYLTPDTKTMSRTENLQIFAEIPHIRAEAQRLKRDGVKIIIAVGHSGFKRDVEIAQKVSEISVVVGGHSHTLLYTPKDNPPSNEPAREVYPYMVVQKSGKKVPVVQAASKAKYLGKLLLTFDDNGDVLSAEGNPILLGPSIKKDPVVHALVQKWTTRLNQRVSEVIGHTRVFLQRADDLLGRYESNLGNLITDAVQDLNVRLAKEKGLPEWTSAPIVIAHQGTIRCDIDHRKNNGAVTLGDIMTVLPFANGFTEVDFRGSTIKAALEHGVSGDLDTMRAYLHFSGMRVLYDMNKPKGSRVQSIWMLCKRCSVPQYEPYKPDEIYTVLLDSFILHGADRFTMFMKEKITVKETNIHYAYALTSYFKKVQSVYPVLDGRISTVQSASMISAKISKYLFVLPLISIVGTIRDGIV